MTGLIAFYIVIAMLLDAEPSALFRLPMGILSEDLKITNNYAVEVSVIA